MDVRELTPDLSVGSQIRPRDMAEVRRLGFRSIIGNRPDREGWLQPSWRRVSAAAEAAGIETRFVPVVSFAITDDQVRAFAAAVEELPKPILAYCRSGARSQMLWDMAQALD